MSFLSKQELNGLKRFLTKKINVEITDIDYWVDHINWGVPSFHLLLQIITKKKEDLDEYLFDLFEDEIRTYLKLISKSWSGPIKIHLL